MSKSKSSTISRWEQLRLKKRTAALAKLNKLHQTNNLTTQHKSHFQILGWLCLVLLVNVVVLILLQAQLQTVQAAIDIPIPGTNGGSITIPDLSAQPANDKINTVVVCKNGTPFQADWLEQALRQRNTFDLARELKNTMYAPSAPKWYFTDGNLLHKDPFTKINQVPLLGHNADLMGADVPGPRIGNVEGTATHFRAYQLPASNGGEGGLAVAVSQERTDLSTMGTQLGRGRFEHPLIDLNDNTQRFMTEEIIAGLKSKGFTDVQAYRVTPYGNNISVTVDAANGGTTYNGAVRLIVVDCGCM